MDIIKALRATGLPVVRIDDELRQCDCCGKFRRDIITIWADHVGETSACAPCRGWPEENE